MPRKAYYPKQYHILTHHAGILLSYTGVGYLYPCALAPMLSHTHNNLLMTTATTKQLNNYLFLPLYSGQQTIQTFFLLITNVFFLNTTHGSKRIHRDGITFGFDLLLTIFNEGAYLTFKPIPNKALNLF